jgi:endonuclease/exonuclease/phosphatase family metal-dependent hydrolase
VRWKPLFAAAILPMMLLSACSDLPTSPDPTTAELSMGTPVWGGDAIKVMTRNLFLGADQTPILLFEPDPELSELENLAAFAAVVNEVWEKAQETDFATRAKRLAWEIGKHQPHAVGLQEVTTYVQTGPSGATIVELDFLDVLIAELAARGLDYDMATIATNLDITLPIDLLGNEVQYIDQDAVIVRGDVEVENEVSGNYPLAVTVPVPTFVGPLLLLRGWNRMDLTANGQTFHFVNTHLEPDEISNLAQAGQAEWLLTSLLTEDDPVVLVGDLNADPVQTASPNAYDVLTAFSYTDGWPVIAPAGQQPGYTCCHDPDLMNPRPNLFERIDYVTFGPGFPLGMAQAWLVGNVPASARPYGLWTSDHAGVVVKFEMAPPAGLVAQ